MSKIILPAIGTAMPKLGGTFWAIQRALPGSGQPDYALIVPHGAEAQAKDIAWGGYGDDEPAAACMYDGLANTQAIIASGLECPAAQACVAADIDGHADWYLPSRRELALCYANVPDLFKETWYWSSTQDSGNYAWGQYFTFGHQGGGSKKFEGRVRLVRRIQLSA